MVYFKNVNFFTISMVVLQLDTVDSPKHWWFGASLIQKYYQLTLNATEKSNS